MIQVLVADDHPVVRTGLEELLGGAEGIEVVAEAADAAGALGAAGEHRPDVAVLDVSMPGPGIVALIKRLRAVSPGTRVLVLSLHSEAQYAVRTIRAGAAGYLTKDQPGTALIEAVRCIAAGRRYITAELAEQLAAALAGEIADEPHRSLSDREFEVLRLIASGRPLTEIAETLHLSPKTVSTYRQRVLVKLRLRSTGELIRYAVEHGLG